MASFLPDKNIHLDSRCISFEQNDREVEIYFENGKTAKADLLIGADGLNSAVRNNLIADGKPRYLNSISWRAVIQDEHELLNPNEIVRIVSDKQFLFLINVGNGYLCWTSRKFASEYIPSANGDEIKSLILKDLTHWAEPIRKLIETTPSEKIFEAPICDRPPLKTWSKGRVTLLGDAAHPMSPTRGQGANSTFEDAWVLAGYLSQASTLEEALRKYEKERIERTSIIQTRSFESEKKQWQLNDKPTELKQPRNTDIDFNDWLYSYKPFAGAIAI